MASRYFRFCRSGLYHELKVTISNDLVSRSKRPFDSFQEGEQALQPEVKKQLCGSLFPSQKASEDYADSDLDDSLLEYADGESPDSVGTLEDEDRLLADDSETDTSDVSLGFSVKEVGSGFAEASSRVTQQQSVPKAPDVSPEPLPLTGLSVPSSSSLPHSSVPANPGGGSNADVDSPDQTGLSGSPHGLGLQDVISIEAGSFSLKKGDDGSGIVDKEATQTVGEESPVVSQLMTECECASAATDRPSEGQAFVEQSEIGGESARDPPCETQGESDSAAEVATEHSITARNEDRVEDPGPEEPENPSPKEPEDPSPDDSTRCRIFIPEDLLDDKKDKYVKSVLAHAQHSRIGPVNEMRELLKEVASEYYCQDPIFRHPTDLTMRNYAQRTNREIQKCSLEKWVNRNRRHFRRFADIPDKFERSPIPSR